MLSKSLARFGESLNFGWDSFMKLTQGVDFVSPVESRKEGL